MFCAGRVEQADIDRTVAACGGTMLTTVSQICAENLGSCAEFYEQQVGSERSVDLPDCFIQKLKKSHRF